ncbi:MAG: sensor histidine kinase [Verrucomicrobia bacterium]|nr:sensor histidine kinase [Verrucomicrobiota bacterium]
MNPLPRFLGLALFVVLAALSALLTVPAWRGASPEAPSPPSAAPVLPSPAARAAALSQRFALALSLGGLVLAVVLVISLAHRPVRSGDTKPPFASARTEIDALAKLAESSVAQGAELTRERDVRRRAEEDAQLKQHLLAQSVEEKVRLGHDLHDGIIQSLYAVGLTVESARALLQSDPAEADRRLEQSRAALNNTIRDVRTYITGLSPDSLRHGSFARALDGLLAELASGREVRCDVKIDDAATGLLSPEQAVDLLQISREAVSNALRHGGASLITVRVHQGDHEVCLLVQDNGTGFDASARRDGGHGLGNMRARADRLGATVRLHSQPGDGTRVVVTLPLRSAPTA